jgi:aminomethyltransferase
MTLRTPLHDRHRKLGARLVDFAGWEMPLHYGSQLNEHLAVRRDAGIFDVSHMTITDIAGPDSEPYLLRILANSVTKLTTPGLALYSCLLNEAGGIIDDVVLYRLEAGYRLVSNAGTRERVRRWLQQQAAGLNLLLQPRDAVAMLAIQGPQALTKLLPALPVDRRDQIEALSRYSACWLDDDLVLARTGYTGEDGVELMCGAERALEVWDYCLSAGIVPIGLGARDSLRLEAGMNLYGADMDESVSPLECGLGWTITDPDRQPAFIGSEALAELRKQGPRFRQAGLVLLDKGVIRGQQTIDVPGLGTGIVTSGGYAPSLDRSIGLARLPTTTAIGCNVTVDVRGRSLHARTVQPPFVRAGKLRIDLPTAP